MIPGLTAKSLRKKSVLLGFSGGADSSAAVLLLKKQEYHVVGFHFSVSSDADIVLEEKKHVDAIAHQLDIHVLHKDMSKQFDQNVIIPFCEAYKSGQTPNPCVMCNPYIKFNALYTMAREMGFPKIATGHYARIYSDCDSNFFVRQAKNIKKDQSYMLYRLSADLLSHVIFPLGDIDSKVHIRNLLKEYKISNAETKDSQDICFIKNNSYKEFLNERGIISLPGNYEDKDGQVIGRHTGIENYTIGQRKGLGKAFGKPMFVSGINQKNNTVILGEENELYKDSVCFSDLFFTVYGSCEKLPFLYQNVTVHVKLRYTAKPVKALLTQENTQYPVLKFTTPQKSPTPGQSVVIYQNDIVIGGGIIV